MDFDTIRILVGFIASIATIFGFLFNVFINWSKFKSRLSVPVFAFGSVVWWLGIILSLVGTLLWGASIFQGLSIITAKQPQFGFALTFSGLTILTGYQIVEQISWKDYSHIWLSVFWGLGSLFMAIAYFDILIFSK